MINIYYTFVIKSEFANVKAGTVLGSMDYYKIGMFKWKIYTGERGGVYIIICILVESVLLERHFNLMLSNTIRW